LLYFSSFILPADFSINLSSFFIKVIYVIFTIPIITLIISIFIWSKYGRNKIERKIEVYPTKEYNSLDIAFFYKGSINKKNVTSLFFIVMEWLKI